MTTETDKLTDLMQKPAEPRPMWIARVGLWLISWWKKPRSRIGLVLVASAMLFQGCSTAGRLGAAVGATAGVVAWHNYCVAEAERDERAQIDAGLTPLVLTNGGLVQKHKWGYIGFGLLGALAGNQIADYAADKAETTTVYPPANVENNYFPDPDPEPATEGGE
jgi:hypothetical protein